jgi:hypothetical protein
MNDVTGSSAVMHTLLMLYMIAACMVSCALILFAVVGISLAATGKYSWKAILFLWALILSGVFFLITGNLALVIAMVAGSPVICLIITLINRKHRKQQKHIL